MDKEDSQGIEKTVLTFLDKNPSIDNTEEFETSHKIAKEALDPVLKSLSAEEYIKLDVIEKKLIELTDEGKSYA